MAPKEEEPVEGEEEEGPPPVEVRVLHITYYSIRVFRDVSQKRGGVVIIRHIECVGFMCSKALCMHVGCALDLHRVI